MSAIENCIEFLKGSEMATVTFSSRRHISAIRKLKEKHPDQVQICHDVDDDGYLLCHLPTSWVRIIPSRQVSDENRERMRVQAFRMREKVQQEQALFAQESPSTIRDDKLYLPGGLEPFYDEITGILTWS